MTTTKKTTKSTDEAPAKKTAAKKATTKKTAAAKKPAAKKETAPKKTSAKKTAAKPAAKKPAVKKTAVKKTTPKAEVKAAQILAEKPAAYEAKPQPKPAPKPQVAQPAPAVAPQPAVKPAPVLQPKSAPVPVQPSPKPQVVQPKPAPVVQPKPQPASPAPQPQAVAKPTPVKAQEPAKSSSKTVRIVGQPTVKELAEKMNFKINDFIKKLMMMGIFATINQRLEKDMIELVVAECGFEAEMVEEDLKEAAAIIEAEDDPASLKPRSPVITIMGHVDHGKTSLLDAIRKSNVVAGEAGAITQHIGAYRVTTPRGVLTFLDTPGHEAFTAMRARGAQATDIVVLVVSATDGIMPQTIEAMEHAKAAGAPIIVAVNKIDLPGANPDRVRQDLAARGLVPEEWQGNTIFVEISAKKHINIDKLLEMIALQAEMMGRLRRATRRATAEPLP